MQTPQCISEQTQYICLNEMVTSLDMYAYKKSISSLNSF